MHLQLENIIQRELNAMSKEDSSHPSDSIAAVAGGLCGIFNAWSSSKNSFDINVLTDSAINGAKQATECNKIARKVDKFEIKHLCGDGERKIIVINGFLTEDDDAKVYWEALPATIENTSFYALNWESGAKSNFSAFHEKLQGSSDITEAFAHLNTNPWKVASAKSENVGILLAQVLRQSPALFYDGVSLIGHSLGAAIIVHALKSLSSTGHSNIINDALLLGAALPNIKDEWQNLPKSLKGHLVNVYSTNDHVLTKLFNIGTFSSVPAAGCASVEVEGIINIDATTLIDSSVSTQFGHSYNTSLEAIINRVQQHKIF